MFIWLRSCAFWLNSSMTLPISGETESIASLKANPRALFAVAFSMAIISLALMNEKLPLKRRSEERRVGKECVIRVDLGGRRIIKKKKREAIQSVQVLARNEQ